MKERIDIIVPDSVLAENPQKIERLQKTNRFEPTDRAPVWVDLQIWALLAARGVTFAEFIHSPREHLRHHILNAKWRVEHIRDDAPIETQRLAFTPDFGALRGTEFPIEVEWLPDQPAKSKHLITEPEQIDTLAIPDPSGGLNAKKIEFYLGMKAALDDFEVRLNGQPLQVDAMIYQQGGPIPSAFALCGSNLFLWMKSEPERVHRLLDLVTESHLRGLVFFDQLTGANPVHPVWLGADSAEMMSANTFREFAVPYYKRIWEQYPRPRIFHMCGKINHLLEVLRDELHIDRLDGFGFPADRQLLQQHLAGRVVLRGGPHPGLVRDGPAHVLQAECEEYLKTAGSRGGFILSEGFGLAPGTPPAHIDAMVAASKKMSK